MAAFSPEETQLRAGGILYRYNATAAITTETVTCYKCTKPYLLCLNLPRRTAFFPSLNVPGIGNIRNACSLLPNQLP